MNDPNDALTRTNELLEQLLAQEQQKTAYRQEQMRSIRDTVNFEIPKFEGLAHDAITTGFRDPSADARIQKIRQEAEEKHLEEMAFRDRLVAILDEQTAILTEIAARLRK